MKKIFILMTSFFAAFFFNGCFIDDPSSSPEIPEPEKETEWTIMYYGDGDNDLEECLLDDVQEMKDGFRNGCGANLIVLFDRIPGESNDRYVFGENFTDTRLYRVGEGRTWRLSGETQFPEIKKNGNYEANMADPLTLKKFIRFCKENYPAEKYCLVMSNHGGGPMKKSLSGDSSDFFSTVKNICLDDTNGKDYMLTAGMSDTLTKDESVDLFVLDACFMGSVEFAYQFRKDASNTGFTAEYMAASAPKVWGAGLDYESILDGFSSHKSSAEELGKFIVDTQKEITNSLYAGTYGSGQSFALYDMSKVKAVKTAVDALAKKGQYIKDSVKSWMNNLNKPTSYSSVNPPIHYFDAGDNDEFTSYPFFDLYDLASKLSAVSSASSEAAAVKTAVGNMIVKSFGNSAYSGFIDNCCGVSIFLPDSLTERKHKIVISNGSSTISYYETYEDYMVQWWYSPARWIIDEQGEAVIQNDESIGTFAGGKLDWCRDGATFKNRTVENWYEFLEYVWEVNWPDYHY